MIWRRKPGIEELQASRQGTLVSHLGIEFTTLADDWLEARMPVDERTRQPLGLLHGGASVALAETIGSVAAYLCVEEGKKCVGLEINANHIRPAIQGWVTGRAAPLHLGRTTQVWEIRIRDDHGHLVCVSRLTMAIL